MDYLLVDRSLTILLATIYFFVDLWSHKYLQSPFLDGQLKFPIKAMPWLDPLFATQGLLLMNTTETLSQYIVPNSVLVNCTNLCTRVNYNNMSRDLSPYPLTASSTPVVVAVSGESPSFDPALTMSPRPHPPAAVAAQLVCMSVGNNPKMHA